MANTKSPVGRIVDAAKRVVDAVTPGEESGRSEDKRGPIPATSPPGLKKAGETAKRVASTTAKTAKDAASKTVETAKGAAGATVDTARRSAGRTGETARSGAKDTKSTAKKGARKTAKKARSGAEDTTSTAKKGARKTAKKARSGARSTADSAKQATGSDKPGPGVPYEEWTKADLYERAQELDISGRSSMNKSELIDALRDHN